MMSEELLNKILALYVFSVGEKYGISEDGALRLVADLTGYSMDDLRLMKKTALEAKNNKVEDIAPSKAH